jgi:hypothetical protein
MTENHPITALFSAGRNWQSKHPGICKASKYQLFVFAASACRAHFRFPLRRLAAQQVMQYLIAFAAVIPVAQKVGDGGNAYYRVEIRHHDAADIVLAHQFRRMLNIVILIAGNKFMGMLYFTYPRNGLPSAIKQELLPTIGGELS